VIRLLLLIRDVSILVEAEHFRAVLERKLIDVVPVHVDVSVRRREVELRVRVVVSVFEVLGAVVLLQGRQQATQIELVSDTTTVVNLAGDVDKSLPWDLILLIEEELEHGVGSLQIRVIELILGVPSKRTELSSLLHNSMHERKSKQHLLPDLRLLATVDEGVVEIDVGSLQVGLETSRRLGGELNTILEHTSGEEGSGHGGEEEAEVGADSIRQCQIQHHLLHIRHESLGQMAILKHHPKSFLGGVLDKTQGSFSLTLSKRDFSQ